MRERAIPVGAIAMKASNDGVDRQRILVRIAPDFALHPSLSRLEDARRRGRLFHLLHDSGNLGFPLFNLASVYIDQEICVRVVVSFDDPTSPGTPLSGVGTIPLHTVDWF